MISIKIKEQFSGEHYDLNVCMVNYNEERRYSATIIQASTTGFMSVWF